MSNSLGCKDSNVFCCGRPDIYNKYLTKTNRQKFEKLLFTILKNKEFVYNVIKIRKMARSYYNNQKNYCTVFNMNKVEGGSGRLNVFLNYTDNTDKNSIDFNRRTFLTRVVDLLPAIWSCHLTKAPGFKKLSAWKNYTKESGTPYPKLLPFCSTDEANLSDNEKIIKKYVEYGNFFTEVVSALKFAITTFSERREYCKVFHVPAFLDEDNKGYKITLTGDELRILHCFYLRNNVRYSGVAQNKLPGI